VRVVNLVKFALLNSRLFAMLCEEKQARHKSLLLHLEVRWLSPGEVAPKKTRTQVFTGIWLYSIQQYLDKKWRVLVPYLSHIFDKINGLNSALQGPNRTFWEGFGLREEDNVLEKPLYLWHLRNVGQHEWLEDSGAHRARNNIVACILVARQRLRKERQTQQLHCKRETAFLCGPYRDITRRTSGWVSEPPPSGQKRCYVRTTTVRVQLKKTLWSWSSRGLAPRRIDWQ
jgi:hypothetical protein